MSLQGQTNLLVRMRLDVDFFLPDDVRITARNPRRVRTCDFTLAAMTMFGYLSMA